MNIYISKWKQTKLKLLHFLIFFKTGHFKCSSDSYLIPITIRHRLYYGAKLNISLFFLG